MYIHIKISDCIRLHIYEYLCIYPYANPDRILTAGFQPVSHQKLLGGGILTL